MSAYERGETDIPDYSVGRIWWDPPWSLYQWPLVWPFYFGGDEFWRRTFVIHLPLLGRLVIPISRKGATALTTDERKQMNDDLERWREAGF